MFNHAAPSLSPLTSLRTFATVHCGATPIHSMTFCAKAAIESERIFVPAQGDPLETSAAEFNANFRDGFPATRRPSPRFRIPGGRKDRRGKCPGRPTKRGERVVINRVARRKTIHARQLARRPRDVHQNSAARRESAVTSSFVRKDAQTLPGSADHGH